MNERKELFMCECGSTEHQMIFSWWPDDTPEDKALYIHVHLAQQPFFKRVWLAIRYVFGYHCRFGHWDEVILWMPETKRLAQMLQEFYLSGTPKCGAMHWQENIRCVRQAGHEGQHFAGRDYQWMTSREYLNDETKTD